jgi:hypothetical protein
MPVGRAHGAAPEFEVRLGEWTIPARSAGAALVEAPLQNEFSEGAGRDPHTGLEIRVKRGVLRKQPGLANRMIHVSYESGRWRNSRLVLYAQIYFPTDRGAKPFDGFAAPEIGPPASFRNRLMSGAQHIDIQGYRS